MKTKQQLDELKEYLKVWRRDNQEKIKQLNHKYKIENREYLAEQKRIKYREDKQFKAKSQLRTLLYSSLKYYFNTGTIIKSKKLNTLEIITYLIKTMPSDFERGKYHIDHIKPLSEFDLTKPEEIKKAFSINNIRWLTKEENEKQNARSKK